MNKRPTRKQLKRQRRQDVQTRQASSPPPAPLAPLAEPVQVDKSRMVVLLVVLTSAFLWAYLPTLARMVDTWQREPDYSHGFFVIPLALLFLYMRRDLMPALSQPAIVPGLALICAGLAMRLVGAYAFIDAVDGWSMLLWIAGCVWLFCGRQVMLWSAPVIGFLFFMIPIPYRAERMLSIQLQNVATKLSCWTLQFFGQPAIAEGRTIVLDDQTLGVAEACSGMRIFVGSIALAAAYMILVRRTWWERGLLVLFIVPVALVSNAARIACTVLLYNYTDLDHKVAHDYSGYAMIPFAAALFGCVVWYLGKLIQEADQMDVGAVVRREQELQTE